MPTPRPFRFGAQLPPASSWPAFADKLRRIENLGYATCLIPDHFGTYFAPIAALTAAALATTTLRVGCTVFDNDFRHPALLAKEAATLDVLSGGRLEFGLGAGWAKAMDYDPTGISFDPPRTRVERLEESVALIKQLWEGGPVTFSGRHYHVTNLTLGPRPLQQPHPPIFLGGGGKRLLSFAAREADIVGILAQAAPEGGLDAAAESGAMLAQQVAWVREAAGERLAQLELAMLFWDVEVTADRQAGAEAAIRRAPLAAGGRGAEAVLASPYFLIGSVDAILEQVLTLRERFGISYFSVFNWDVEEFAPVVARLAGT